MKLPFTKMHGLGNDFVVFDFTQNPYHLTSAQVRFIADRHLGVGCDQVLVVQTSQTENADFFYRIFNADGSEVEQCGNGARCFAQFIRENNLSNKNPLTVETRSGIIKLEYENTSRQITVDMGAPRFSPKDIPIDTQAQRSQYSLILEDNNVEFSALSMGNPHAVILVDDINTAPVASIGKALEQHPFFPKRANIGFLQVLNKNEVSVRVYERGAAETQACGSGACAAVVAGTQQGLLEGEVLTHLLGGSLTIEWPGDDQTVRMRGPATTVFIGEIELPDLN